LYTIYYSVDNNKAISILQHDANVTYANVLHVHT